MSILDARRLVCRGDHGVEERLTPAARGFRQHGRGMLVGMDDLAIERHQGSDCPDLELLCPAVAGRAVAGRPMLYLLSGLPCSGKTTYAAKLESSGAVRISVDEMLIESVGQLGINYDNSDHIRLLEPVVIVAQDRVAEYLAAGDDVVLDHGLGRRIERDEFKQLAEASGARWRLLCFEAKISTLRSRCRQRSGLPGQVPISNEVLDHLAATWERPSGEGETVIVTD